MAQFFNKCIDSADWVEEVTKTMEFPKGYRPEKNIITLKELSEISTDYTRNGGDMGLPVHWDFPLSETDMLVTEEENAGQKFVLVRFDDTHGGYEYRWCEID